MADAEKAEQQSLLPEFEGTTPSGADLSFVGTTRMDQKSEPSRYGEEVYYLIKGMVTSVAHKRKGSVGMVRRHVVDVETAYKLDEFTATGIIKEADSGERSITQISHRHRLEDDGDDQSGEGAAE